MQERSGSLWELELTVMGEPQRLPCWHLLALLSLCRMRSELGVIHSALEALTAIGDGN